MSLFKAQAHMRELKQRLQLQLSSSSIYTDSLDSDGMPQLMIGLNSENHFIKIQPLADGASHVDGLGLAQRVYSPHEAYILREAAATAAAGNAELRERLVAACSKLGMKLTIKEGTGVNVTTTYATAASAASTTVAQIRSDEINPLTQSQ